mmetsp:Transcript_53993/g.156847  ORF Transcript_53993/g.156847 Transcript_53993/m.156847 type:complete len:218 (+) Transcript_53993:1254-1907(+)
MLCEANGTARSTWLISSPSPKAMERQEAPGVTFARASRPIVELAMPQNTASVYRRRSPNKASKRSGGKPSSREIVLSSGSERTCTNRISCHERQSRTSTWPKRLSRSFTGAKASSNSFDKTTDAPASCVPRSLTVHSGASLAPALEHAGEAARAASTGLQLPRVCASPLTTRRPRAVWCLARAGERSMITYSKAACHLRQVGGSMPSSLFRTHCCTS